MTEKSKPLFEHVTCSRCGGSGSYSFNLMHGSKCYGCNGTGYKLTKRGSAAQQFFHDLAKVKVSDLKVGDLVWFDMWGFRCCERITSIDEDQHNPGRVIVRAIRTKTGEPVGLGAYPDFHMQRGLPTEEKREMRQKALDYQATLTKAGVPSKRK